jgi:Domain of unknown function (DUF4276)
MNLYFIVEGETERKVYPSWLGYLLPELQRVKNPSQAQANNYYLISGGGYPCLYQEVEAAVENINISQNYNYLIICTDADENSVKYMQQEIREFFADNQLFLCNTKLRVVIQNRCIETWLLGNSKIYSRQPQSQRLLDYTRYYDVSKECPELMGKYNHEFHAEFHEKYLKELFFARKTTYSKTMPGAVQEEYYLRELQNRVEKQANHLPTFQHFIEFCALVRSQLEM